MINKPLASAPRWAYILLAPAVLLLVAYLLGGAHYESNDDPTLKLLLQGLTAARPVDDLHIYFLGWARLLAALYTWMPAVSWFDWLEVGSVYVALAVIFYVLAEILPPGRQGWYLLTIGIALFVGTYVLHLLQINFTRPALLLGGAATGLLALPTGGRTTLLGRWAMAALLFAAGWGIRPIAAELGLLLLMPVWLLQPFRHWGAALLLMGTVVGGLTLSARLSATPAEKQYVHLNTVRTEAFDYLHYSFDLRTPTDSLAYATLALGGGPYDAKLVNNDFLQRCMRPATAPPSLIRPTPKNVVLLLVKHWQKLAIALLLGQWVVVGWALWQGWLSRRDQCLWLFVAYQGFFWVLFFGVGFYFQIVARVAQPMITLYLLGNFLLLAGMGQLTLTPLPGRAWWAAAAGLAFLLTVRFYVEEDSLADYKEQSRAAYLTQLTRRVAPGTVLVEGKLFGKLEKLSLFNSYELPRFHRILTLTGWSTYDPSQPALYRYLTGQPDVATGLLRLGRRPGVTWVLEPKFAALLERYLNARCPLPPGNHIRLALAPGPPLPSGPQVYTFQEINHSAIAPASVRP